MDKIVFLKKIEPYLKLLKGNGREIARRLNMDYQRYNYFLRGTVNESEEYASLNTIGQHHIYIAMTPTSFKVIIDDQITRISLPSERTIVSPSDGYSLYLSPPWGYRPANATLTNICMRSSDTDLYTIETTTFVTTEICRLPSTRAIAVSHGDNIQTAYISYDNGDPPSNSHHAVCNGRNRV